ncbi:MAG TPA: beta-L-arabinofuranosidase domain-containing protein [Rhodanobacter sp.]|jgi:DUF1680 family protein|nr:beta-L-arabinofuranosidase domain-containing protein [Rhodanobacter sp.]
MDSTDMRRRAFLKTVPAVAVGLATLQSSSAGGAAPTSQAPIAEASFPRGRDYPMRPLPFWDVTLKDDFWAPKVRRNAEVTVPFEISKLGVVGDGLEGGVLEAAIYIARSRPDLHMQDYIERCLQPMLAAPTAGYEHRQFELGAALWFTHGDRRLIDKCLPQAAALEREFREQDPPYPGGERPSMSCAFLYRVTRDPRHLALAKHYLDIRGRADSPGRSRHTQSWLPVLEQREAAGHAVNDATLMLSLLDVGVYTGDRRYFDAAHAIWTDAVANKLYVTGGIGQTGNEGFGRPHVLPNLSAYAETCATAMFQNLNQRWFMATGDARYIDLLERGMYNNLLSGVSHSGDHFFYVNRLASAGDGRDERWQHASLECCPPNLVRFLASMPGMIYAQDQAGAIHVNLYVSSEATFTVGGGTLRLAVESQMPWRGRTRIKLGAATPLQATLRLRIPGWARDEPAPGSLYRYMDRAKPVAISVNGAALSAQPDRLGYVAIAREWRDGDLVVIDLPVAPRRIVADARVHDTARRAAISFGPIVYGAEWPEAPGRKALDLVVAPDAPLIPRYDAGFMGGAMLIDTVAHHAADPAGKTAKLTLIPYHLWANRGAGEMSTWLLMADYEVGDVGPAGGLIFHKNPNATRDGWRYLEAMPFDQSQSAKWGCFRHDVTGAKGTAIGTGKRNTAEMLASCDEPASAARLCATLSFNGVSDWFLPSRDELTAMYQALKATGIGDFRDGGMPDNCEYWTSSQNDTDMATHIDFADAGRVHGDDKDFPRRVRAIRAF